MLLPVIVGSVTCLTMIICVLFYPQIKIKKVWIDTSWVVVLLGAIVLILSGGVDIKFLASEIVKDSAMNPLKILVLFVCMTVLSVFLDEIGFFSYLAGKTLKLAKNSQLKLFVWLYVIVSILTVFTSNDIIVLTFTPFICYFAKNARINPLPYLVTEFVGANTMSMTFIIGNPTNIYIATSYGIGFIQYLKVMFLPTLASALVSFLVLYLLFRKELKKPAQTVEQTATIKNKLLLVIGLIHLGVCTIILAIGSYVNIEMGLVSLISAISLILWVTAICLIKKSPPKEITRTLVRAPWQLVPFVLSMFTLILGLQASGVTDLISNFLGGENAVFKYGALSFLSSNIINNIPMSVFFCPIIAPLNGIALNQAVYATIIGSNLGAILTPIGALAGIMWTALLKSYNVKYSYLDFIKYGLAVSIPSLTASLGVLALIL
ncbi:MAG: hypothetical protein II988_00220 [Clostridia bacterium]|nr:hypothetical protein [Clostridia bacterium]